MRTANSEQRLFARLKAELKRHAFIYYPLRYCKIVIQETVLFLIWYAYKHTVKFNRDGLNKTEHRERKIIASLTSYPARINIVPYVIASLLNQTIKPDKIILWLAEGQFPERKLPEVFKEVKACGAEVRFCPEDLGPHKKYFYAMQEYPNDIIITFDDDFIYSKSVIETLYISYCNNTDCVSAMLIREILFASDGSLRNWREWIYGIKNRKGTKSHTYIALTGAGTLYPPNAMHKEAFNTMSIMKYCPKADDLWCKIMEALNNVRVVSASDKGKVPAWRISGSQKEALKYYNDSADGNDIQMKAMLNAYNTWPEGTTLLEMMKEDGSGVK